MKISLQLLNFLRHYIGIISLVFFIKILYKKGKLQLLNENRARLLFCEMCCMLPRPVNTERNGT